MNPDPDERPSPEDAGVPDAFDSIVSGWRHDGQVPVWPFDDPVPDSLPPFVHRPSTPLPLEEEHFVPPEPPPLPRFGPPALVGLALLALGIVLVLSPRWVGVSTTYGLPLGLLVLASGLGWLVLRLWPDGSDSEPPDDDGAIL